MTKAKTIIKNIVLTIAMPLAIYLIFVIVTRLVPGAIPFGSLSLLKTVLQNSVMSILVALGLCMNMPTGRIDMSAGIVVILTTILGARIANMFQLSAWLYLLLSIVIAVVLSLITACIYLIMKLPVIIVTLGIVIIYEAVSGVVFGGAGVTVLENRLRVFGFSPYCFIVLILALILFHIITEHTTFAYKNKLLAGDQQVAVKTGVDEKKNILFGFGVAGIFFGLAATVYLSMYGQVESASNMSSASVMFDSLLPVIIGMVLARFSCQAIGVAIAVFSMKMISYGMFCLGFNASAQNIVAGIFIIVLLIITGLLAQKPEVDRVRARARMLNAEIAGKG